ncbi:unnamed protein product [Urochloa humidicola]
MHGGVGCELQLCVGTAGREGDGVLAPHPSTSPPLGDRPLPLHRFTTAFGGMTDEFCTSACCVCGCWLELYFTFVL